MSRITFELLERLVAFDTTSRHSNLALIEWVAAYLQRHGVASRFSYNDDRSKANLFARIGPEGRPVLLLSGHSDVVPVDGQVWQSDPFVLSEREGRYYGRGAADMKGFIACVLASVPDWVELARNGLLEQPLGIALSYDEEVGCLGVAGLIDDLKAGGIEVAGCIIGEPTSMVPVVAHKGIAHYRCRVTGRAAHSSLTPRGVNAIEYAARLIAHIRRLADAEAQFGRRHALYDVPFATLQTGMVRGGTAANIVPGECEFVFECRWLPGDRHQRYVDSLRDYAATVLGEMREVAPEADIELEALVDCPPFEADAASRVMALVDTLCGGVEGQGVAYTTEAGRFHEAGIPCVVCGPGAIEQAHRADEYIEGEQIETCCRWLQTLTRLLSGRGE
ncbi:acetylornithine deacetylase [Paludibacterium yongneupense]|uniref:acetylornithine deacetylase n=1 Tax=Paludibacterium yongneupense TaxID=400061 RepID=UPI00048CE3A8|nr:acetylornithine deacetylase [Paludibacterium yongneupense]